MLAGEYDASRLAQLEGLPMESVAMDYLEVVDGAGRRRRVELDRARLLIGREPSCDICLPHPGVSRRHAQLQATEQGRWLLQDLSSRNHVYVDDSHFVVAFDILLRTKE